MNASAAPRTSSRWRFAPTSSVINRAYPAAGSWSFSVARLVVESEQAVTDVVVSDGAVTARANTFTTVRDGRIVSQVEYWLDPFEAPGWRAVWVERLVDRPSVSTDS